VEGGLTLDQLSGGRAVLTVGLGATTTGLPLTGEVLDLRTRADMLDEGIDLIRALWAGGTAYHGRHYDYVGERDDLVQVGRPVQERIPIWVVGAWPRPKSMRRVLRCDGVVPQYPRDAGTPGDAGVVRAWLDAHGARPDLDLIAEGETPATDPAAAGAQVRPWAQAGCTWWLETRWELPHHTPDRMAQIRQRLAAGPPG
jgi:alkanesulfonate monooxygenase SsuD/methylene tetrahydromethanopterin reductase-like flavin-dependent oxidoreductase (luciferase family)